jgi:hypothetical protein
MTSNSQHGRKFPEDYGENKIFVENGGGHTGNF